MYEEFQVIVQVRKIHPEARLPRYAHTGPYGDLAADLYSVSAATLAPGETVAVPTGWTLGLPGGFGALIEDRSGLALRGLTTLAGVIDPGYRGELRVVLTNLSAATQMLAAGDRVAQLRIVRRIEAVFEERGEDGGALDETSRGAGGFGSTGA